MLACVWDALSEAIPRLQAEERLSEYTVAVVASPHVEQDSRDSILDGWRKVLLGEKGSPAASKTASDQKHSTPREMLHGVPSPIKGDPRDQPIKDVFDKIKSAFGRQIRE